MRYRAVSKVIGFILVVFAAAMILPAVTGVYFGESEGLIGSSYGIPALISTLIGILLMYIGKGEEDLRDRDALITVALTWLIISLLGAMPFMLSGAIPDPAGAFFESTSGFTTTGASVIPDLENQDVVPRSILMWRATTHLIGGMGIIVLSMVVLSRLVGGSTQLFKAEASVHTSIRMKPTLRQIAGTLWSLYLGFTGLEIVLLMGAGMGPFDAVCHSFATLATGGFSTKNASIAYYNAIPAIGAITAFFMILGGMSFVVHYEWLTGKFNRLRQNPEVKLYLGLIIGASVLIWFSLSTVSGWNPTEFSGERFAHSMFQVVAVMTTTGFATADFVYWPSEAQMVLFFLMLIGACSGSTAGGLKVVRFVVLAKMVRREIRKAIHPRAVMPITLGDRPIPEDVQRNVVSFFFVYLTIFCIVALGLAMVGMTTEEALSASASSLGNVGPALGRYGPMSNYGALNDAGQVLMAIAMWIGRLEIYPALLLLSPSAYKR